jgi:threonine dehydrogenase-like Zn-dependent dehydrogenase
MKAAFYPGEGKPIVIQNVPDPEPGPDDVVIKVHRCGICATDLTMTKGEMWDYGAGQFGHEYAGEIVAFGKNVTGFRTGDNICVLPSLACGHCEACKYENHVLCRNAGSAMVGFAEYARMPANVAIKLPSVLSTADGALIEPLAICLYGVRKAGIQAGDKVLVLGAGSIGAGAAYWAKRLGAQKVVAMSRSDRRKDLVLGMGADAFIKYGDNEVGDVIEALGGSPDIVYECVGVPGMLGRAVQHVRMFGKVVSLGFCVQPDPVIPAIASYKCASMQFFVGYEKRDFLYIAEHLDKGHADPKMLISNTISLDELPTKFAAMREPNDEIKVHVCMA